jgi:hypothetical protein
MKRDERCEASIAFAEVPRRARRLHRETRRQAPEHKQHVARGGGRAPKAMRAKRDMHRRKFMKIWTRSAREPCERARHRGAPRVTHVPVWIPRRISRPEIQLCRAPIYMRSKRPSARLATFFGYRNHFGAQNCVGVSDMCRLRKPGSK